MGTDKIADADVVPYPAIPARRKSGNETFMTEDGPVAILLDFWAWAYSDLIGNTERGRLAEYIVALALGCEGGISASFGKCDLRTSSGISVEVKTSAYLQSWNQKKLSEISFGIETTLGWDSVTNEYEQERKRQSDVYVFCVHAHKEQSTLSPLNIFQWEFWVLSATTLDETVADQKTISLPRLEKLGAVACTYSGLRDAVAQAADCKAEQHAPTLSGVHGHSTSEEKISLFRSPIFRTDLTNGFSVLYLSPHTEFRSHRLYFIIRDRELLFVNSNNNSLAVVYLVLDNLSRPACKGF